MRRLLLVVIPTGLLLFLALPSWASPSAQISGAERVTERAGLLALEAWPRSGHVVARTDDGWQRIALEDGALSPSEPMDIATRSLTIEQGGAGHGLQLDGETLWRSASDIVAQATLSPDGQWLVAARTPRGSETASLSELWRYDLPTDKWRRLTHNGAAEGYPLISPDGTQVAFLRDGDLWLIPADRTTHESLSNPTPEAQLPPRTPTDHEPPDMIRVKHVSQGVSNPNSCRPNVPHGQIDVIPFEEYVKRVVPYEVPSYWPTETLKAQAIAARSYGWYYVIFPAGTDYDVTDTTSHQYMCDETFAATNAAVDATEGMHLSYEGDILKAFFSAENSSPTRQYPNWEPISAVDDPLSFGYERYGHGWGLSQWGAKRHADAGWTYLQILRHYYTSTVVEPPAGNTQTLLDLANRPERAYLRGAGAFATLNASNVDLTRVRSWYNDPGTGWQYSDWQDRSYDPDYGWWHLFDIRTLPDTPFDDYRLEGASVPENVGLDPRPVLRLGIDRTPPTLEVTLSQTIGTATFDLTGDDTLSGLERRGHSLAAWQQEAEAIAGMAVVSDTTASGGAAILFEPGTQAEQTISFAPVALDPAHYRLWFRLRTSGDLGPEKVATLRLIDDLATPLQRGIYPLRPADFASEGWEWFYVDADSTAAYGGIAAGALTPQLTWLGLRTLWVDRVVVATRPDPLPNTIALPLSGPTRVLLYANDGAGNVALMQCELEPLEPAASLYLPLVIGADALAPPANPRTHTGSTVSGRSSCVPLE